jgi:hypothetical protein
MEMLVVNPKRGCLKRIFFTQSNNEDKETKIDFQSLSLCTLCSLCETSSFLRQPLLKSIEKIIFLLQINHQSSAC